MTLEKYTLPCNHHFLKHYFSNQESEVTGETSEDYCANLCLRIKHKNDELLSLQEYLISRLPMITTKEIRHYICTVLHFSHCMNSIGFILSFASIAVYKTFQLGYTRDKEIQTTHHKIRDIEIIILHYMDLLRTLLAEHPHLLNYIDLPEDLYCLCTKGILSANDLRSLR